MLERPDAGDAGMPGTLAKFARMQRMLVGMLATVRGDLRAIYIVFWRSGNVASDETACVQVMQAMLRRSLGCNKTRQRLALRSRRHTAQLD